MKKVGIRALNENASVVVAEAAAGETIIITDLGRPVAQITPLPSSPLQRLIDSGLARPPRRDIRDLPASAPGPSLSADVTAMRDAERF